MKPVTRTEEFLEVKLNDLIAEQKKTNELLLQLVGDKKPAPKRKVEVTNDAK